VNAPHHAFFGTPVRMFEPADLTTLVHDIASGAAPFAKREAEYRANRDTANAHLDAHRDAALAKLGYR